MFLFGVVLLLILGIVTSWGCVAHKFTIKLAEYLIPESNVESIKDILNASPIINSHMIYVNSIKDIVCLPDEIKKERKYKHTAKWHYYDIDYSYIHEELPQSIFNIKDKNIYSAMQKKLAIVKNPKSLEERADAVLFMLHFLGDVMQPMHVSQLVSDEFPEGDLGGLNYKLKGVPYASNLHLFTDAPVKQWESVEKMHTICNENGWYGSDYWDGDVAALIRESHRRGELIYDILDNTHRPSEAQIAEIREVLFEGICRSASVIASFIYDIASSSRH